MLHCLLIITGWLVIATHCWSATPSITSPTAPAPRLKIGLALSGGAARGLAHIGILKALEELRVPIDQIAGTSMGSIIGGLYASGMNIEQLTAAVQTIEWAKVLQFERDRNQLSYRDKQLQPRYFNFEFGLNQNGVTAPSGFINGQDLLVLLKRLTQHIVIDDFAKLPIPFIAVATDLEDASEPYLLTTGDLALALRASMAVPFAFAPVTIEGRLLVDGGIVNNIPVDVVKDMGADIVIAVDIATPILDQVNSSSSLLTVVEQSINISLIQNSIRLIKKADIVIEPDLREFASTDFDKSSGMIARGYQAIQAQAALFKLLSLSPSDYAKYQAAKLARRPYLPKSITPAFIRVEGNHRTDTAALEGKLQTLRGHPVSPQQALKYATNQLMSLSEFEQINFRLERDNLGATGLIFEVREKPWGPHYFQLGLEATTSFDDKIEFTLLARHEKLNINKLGAEWINELKIGTGYFIRTEFYQPLDYDRRWFLAPFASVERSFNKVFKMQNSAEYDVQSMQLGIEAGMTFNKVAEWRGGFRYDEVDADLRVGNAYGLPPRQAQQNLLTFKFGYDNLDHAVFATRGLKLDLTGQLYHQAIGSDRSYQKLSLYARAHAHWGSHVILLSDLTVGTAFNSMLPDYEYFAVGGFNLLSGFRQGQQTGRQALVMRAGGLFDLPSTVAKFGVTEYKFLGLIHAGKAWDTTYREIKLSELNYGGTAAIIWDTQFGVIQLGIGYTDNASLRYHLSLGRLF